MFVRKISCLCGKDYPANKMLSRCKCGGNPDIVLDYAKLRKSLSLEEIRSRPFNQLRYSEFYPAPPITLYEGGTPLIRSRNIEKSLGLKFELHFKNEAVNPTGSFKDRGSSVEVSKAFRMGSRKAVCASTGNMGSSVSAYSAVAGIECHIFTPKGAAGTKIRQILSYGAKVYTTRKEFTEVSEAAEYAAELFGIFLFGDYMYRRQGTKSIGLEISEQISADYVACPIGSGVLMSATWKGLKESKEMRFTKSLPRMIAVQANGSSTVSDALMKHRNIRPLKHPHTIAAAIEVGLPFDGNRAMKSVLDSGGFAQNISDREMLKAKEMLSRKEGMYAEPAGAAALAGILKSSGMIESGSKVVCLVTGHGLKTPHVGRSEKPIASRLDKAALGRIFRQAIKK